MDSIKNKKLVLNGRAILTMAKEAENINQLSKRSDGAYMTIHRYIKNPDTVKKIDLAVFGSMLSPGLGLNSQEIEDIRIGDIFEVVDNE